jgi:hypothetical protein
MQAVQNGSINISRALDGVTIEVGTALWDEAFLKYDEETGRYSGLEYHMLLELGARMGFQWNFNFYVKPDELEWTDVLTDMLDKYDLTTYGYWTETPFRARTSGAVSPRVFMDLSYRAVTMQVQKDEPALVKRMFQFLEPFEWQVWLALILLIISTGGLYLLFERQNLVSGRDKTVGANVKAGAETVYFSFMHFTGPGGLEPSTWSGKLLLASWTWCCVLFISAYTANLASFLVSKNSQDVEYENLLHAMSKNARLCAEEGPAEKWFKQSYPSYNNIAYVASDLDGKEVLRMLDRGDCDVTLVSYMAWMQSKNDRSVDSGCRMKTIGDALNNLQGGWMTRPAYDGKCTAILRDSMAMHLLDMDSEGKIQTFLDAFYSLSGSSCGSGRRLAEKNDSTGRRLTVVTDRSEEDSSDSEPLDFTSMAGIIIVHLGLLVISFIFFFNIIVAKRLQRGLLLVLRWLCVVVSREVNQATWNQAMTPPTASWRPCRRSWACTMEMEMVLWRAQVAVATRGRGIRPTAAMAAKRVPAMTISAIERECVQSLRIAR